MTIINGKKIAKEIIDELKSRPKLKKFFAAVLVGSDPASISFLQQKEKTAEELGVDFRLYKFPAEIKNDALREEVGKIAGHKTCGGVIVQLPLPEHLNRHYILNAIPREKDVDVLSERALGAFYAGRNPVLPPAVGVVEAILNDLGFKIQDLRIAIVGRGLLIGKPVAAWLTDKAREVAVFGSNSDLSNLKNFDLIISGVGKAGIIKPEMLKDGAGIIDFGYSVENEKSDKGIGKIKGDFDSESLSMSHVALNFYTPTPGGTGPILVAKLFENFYKLNALGPQKSMFFTF